MFNLEEAVAFIAATIDNYFDRDTQLRVNTSSDVWGGWDARLQDEGTRDAHISVHGAPSMEAAIIRLACAIREDSDIGG